MSASNESHRHELVLACDPRRWGKLGAMVLLTAFLLTSADVYAGCGSHGASNIMRVGLHLDGNQHAVGQKPIAQGCWWYTGPVNVVYEAGELKYYPVLASVDCRGPNCRRQPPKSEIEVVATTQVRFPDAGDRASSLGKLLPFDTRSLPRVACTFWADPLPASILRPPRLAI